MKKNTLNTVQKIIDAGCRLFAQNGYSATSVDEIMKEAGYSKATFYLYFKSKESLFLHIMNEQMEERFLISMKCFQKKTLRGLLTGIEYLIQKTNKEHTTALFLEFMANSHRYPEIEKKIALLYERWREFFVLLIEQLQEEGIVQTQIPPRVLASTMIAIFSGYNHQHHADPSINKKEQLQSIIFLLNPNIHSQLRDKIFNT
ncbi:TetR family transcriptional regulator [Bacillus glycinifermentans]|uniref:TetR family transcriptional regulator n=1 Tax=Bacillus glycinifermentans TaxID=1664069 RepID=A0A0J6EQT0_9BACI|nr:TetR/AcrR family transcriptional regulator [Bacillus glycinifermentans]ATH91798.1 TetR/AcrR family transcriptional regulator [Bacillus glycinifermentans]KMM62856.1 TetR family transcriptional regulator [Bacillus glycinifermentans]KRT95481.1 TetR family transcriptional regulator [Bacillus glycinifermentans]MEC0483497.1 TetR/AcrR family transcriptional regulator [Bacillus glycinifermentans]MEC0495057.1 TetR/AcrR family transcriptional regulator [Bacillus glycinifermentans]